MEREKYFWYSEINFHRDPDLIHDFPCSDMLKLKRQFGRQQRAIEIKTFSVQSRGKTLKAIHGGLGSQRRSPDSFVSLGRARMDYKIALFGNLCTTLLSQRYIVWHSATFSNRVACPAFLLLSIVFVRKALQVPETFETVVFYSKNCKRKLNRLNVSMSPGHGDVVIQFQTTSNDIFYH